ncbi:MAG: hypothetical protein ACUVRZ_03140 [Desulfobacca sp.]|uniref:hypothetical protein n=1 Tax=Desulfobacca sp. TaxID=2067990 RepID=UPI00404919D6
MDTPVPSQSLPEDLQAILRVVRERGGTDCTGSCHHRQPGEFHCHTLAQMLNISSSGIKKRLLELLALGLLERRRLQRPGDAPLTRFVITAKGRDFLNGVGKSDQGD